MTTYLRLDGHEYRQIYPAKKFLIGHPGFIAGGCFKHLFLGSKVKDYDMFFENEKDYNEAVEHFRNSDNYSEVYATKKVTAFRHNTSGEIVECVKYIYGTPEEIINAFDFTITKFAVWIEESDDDTPDNFTALVHPDFFEHLFLKKTVADDKIIKPFSTFERVIRYTKYGFYPCRETKAKLCAAMNTAPNFTPSELSKSMYDGLD